MFKIHDLVIPINVAKSIVKNKPPHVDARLMQTVDKKPILIVNQRKYINISKLDKRFIRGPASVDQYATRGLDDEQYSQFLLKNPIVLERLGTDLYEIIDGAHRVERAIWLGLTEIPGELTVS